MITDLSYCHPAFRRRCPAALGMSVAALVALCFVSSAVCAPADFWTGATNASWDTLTNWSGGVPPNSSVLASFPATIPGTGGAITLANGEVASSLTFANSYTLNGGTLALSEGNVSVSDGSTETINSMLTGGGSVATTGTGTLVLANPSNDYSGGTTLNAGGTLIANGSPVDGSGTPLGSGRLTINGGTLGTTTEVNSYFYQGTALSNPIAVKGDFSIATNVDVANPGVQNITLNGVVDLNGATRTITGITPLGVVHFGSGGIGGAGETAGVNFTTSFNDPGDYVCFVFDQVNANRYTGLTTVNNDAILVFEGSTPNGAIRGDVDIEGHGVLDYLGGPYSGAASQQLTPTATVTVNSVGLTTRGVTFAGLDLFNSNGETIGTLNGTGIVFVAAAILTVGQGNFSGVITDGDHTDTVGYSLVGGGVTKAGAGTLTLSGNNAYTGPTAVTGGKLVVNGTIASSSGVAVSYGATLSGHGSVSEISGAGLVAPGDPQILTATQVDPSGGLSFAFSFTQPNAPLFGNASASGNDVLHLTGATPFVFTLSAANTITLDFSGATLLADQIYLGGFFTDTDILDSMVNGAHFVFTGLNGAVVQYEGLVQESSAGFVTGTVNKGEVMEFKVVSPAPEPSSWMMIVGGVAMFAAFRRSGHKSAA